MWVIREFDGQYEDAGGAEGWQSGLIGQVFDINGLAVLLRFQLSFFSSNKVRMDPVILKSVAEFQFFGESAVFFIFLDVPGLGRSCGINREREKKKDYYHLSN